MTNWLVEAASLYESEVAFGRSTASQIELTTPVNKRELPCDGCEFEDRCAARFEDCKAFRFWAKNGDFKDADVGKLIRIAKG